MSPAAPDLAPAGDEEHRFFLAPLRHTKTLYLIRHGEGYHNVAQREWRAQPDWDGVSDRSRGCFRDRFRDRGCGCSCEVPWY